MVARRRRSRGWTLPELMLVVSIIGVLTVMGNNLFIQITRFFRLNQARIDIQRDARAAFNLMARNLRQAEAASVVIDSAPVNLAGLPPCGTVSGAQNPPYSRITFNKIGSTNKTVSFFQHASCLYMSAPNAASVTETSMVSKNLLYVAFSHPRVSGGSDEDKIISVSLTMQEATYQGGSKALQLSVQQIRIMN